MKQVIVAALCVFSLAACAQREVPAPLTLEERGLVKTCTPADPATDTPKVCVCTKEATGETVSCFRFNESNQ